MGRHPRRATEPQGRARPRRGSSGRSARGARGGGPSRSPSRSAAVVERGRSQARDPRIRGRRAAVWIGQFRAAKRPHRRLRQRRYAVGGAADLCPGQFAIDRIGAGAAASRVEGDAALQGDPRGRSGAAGPAGHKALEEILAATHAGMTADEFDWHRGRLARHGRTHASDRPYTETGVPAETRVAGLPARTASRPSSSRAAASSSCASTPSASTASLPSRWSAATGTRFECGRRQARADREPQVLFVDDGPGKPVGHRALHRPRARSSRSATPTATCRCCSTRPPAAARDSWLSSITPTPSASGPTTGSRTVGRLDKALDEARQRAWTVVDMRRDWRTIFLPGPATGSRALQ